MLPAILLTSYAVIMPAKTRASNRHVAENTATPPAPTRQPSPPALEYTDLDTMTTDSVQNMDTDEKSPLLPPAEINTDTQGHPGSPEWEIEPHSYLSRCMLDGAYPKLLSALESWKNDPAIASHVAAFMEYGADIKSFPATFGKHLMYRKTRDTPLHIVFFGEVAEPTFGTALGARGNHYIGTAGNVWLYCSCVRDR